MRGAPVRITFHGDLGDLARGTGGSVTATVAVDEPRSVKDAVESCGIPHTEVDLLLVDGSSVGFDHLLRGGEEVAVHPPSHHPSPRAASRVRPPPLPPRFVLDVHLGRLAELLRLLGFDARYRNDRDDDELAAVSIHEGRWLLTRDRGLLMRRAITHGYLVRANDPREQLTEVARRFDLAAAVRPYTRCARCNGALKAVAKAEVIDRLPPRTRVEHDTFVRCESCGRVYWRGSHAPALDEIVAAVRGGSPR